VRLAAALLALVSATGCDEPAQPVQRANPASQNCVQQGGTLAIEREPTGGEIGVCMFEDNRQCEEWALLRGECPVGGIHVAGYATADERLCAIRGGQHTTGECRLPEKGPTR
jgi:putative hemolysin